MILITVIMPFQEINIDISKGLRNGRGPSGPPGIPGPRTW